MAVPLSQNNTKTFTQDTHLYHIHFSLTMGPPVHKANLDSPAPSSDTAGGTEDEFAFPTRARANTSLPHSRADHPLAL